MTDELNNIYNFYEKLVIEYISRNLSAGKKEPGYLADIACVALNHLPPRYIRYEVDMFFYLSPMERKEMEDKIEQAVNNAIEFIEANKN